uniref:Uncharacterized protein n=1 Tax=Anguilla anguilla TaxID=7936 RepID=A0A0E9PKS0_ANGAN
MQQARTRGATDGYKLSGMSTGPSSLISKWPPLVPHWQRAALEPPVVLIVTFRNLVIMLKQILS